MSRIIHIDLSTNQIKSSEICVSFENTARNLVASLIKKGVESTCDYLSDQNRIVLTTGLLTGTSAPSTGRLTIGAKRSGYYDVRTINVAGPLAQKLASLDIHALEITGCSEDGGVVVHIDDRGVQLNCFEEIKYKTVSETIHYLRGLWGEDTSILGIGPSGEHVLPLASVFSTYSYGTPLYYCPRGGMGDIFGYKGLKAICVTTKKHFAAAVLDEETFRYNAKQLGKIIVSHPVCGGALPAYGSITLIQMMKQGMKFEMDCDTIESGKICFKSKETGNNRLKINKNCAPNCVIGCLNRHKGNNDQVYSSPAESEAIAACRNIFEISDNVFVSELNRKCFELGIDTIEFLFSCALFFHAQKESGTKEKLNDMIKQIEQLTPIGRIIGSTTKGIYPLYAEHKNLADQVTKPAHSEESQFNIVLPYKVAGCENLRDFDYLYGFISAIGSLGICLFTSFAILEHPDGMKILSALIKSRTGENIAPDEVIIRSLDQLRQQKEWQQQSLKVEISSYIPEFVKVLYRYFNKEE